MNEDAIYERLASGYRHDIRLFEWVMVVLRELPPSAAADRARRLILDRIQHLKTSVMNMNNETKDERLLRAERERDQLKAEVARLRASQNERAISELELCSGAESYVAGTEFIHKGDAVEAMVEQRLEILRAEQAAAPAPVTPPADESWETKAIIDSTVTGWLCADSRRVLVDYINRKIEAAKVTPPDSDETWLRAPLTGEEIKAVEHATGSKVVTPPSDAPQRPSVEALRAMLSIVTGDRMFAPAESQVVAHIQDAVRLLLDDAIAARGGAS